MNSLSPNLFVKDINETILFYQSIGFKSVMEVPGEDGLVWVMMNRGNVNFMFQTFESLDTELPEISRKNGGSLLLYIQMNEIKKFHDEIAEDLTEGSSVRLKNDIRGRLYRYLSLRFPKLRLKTHSDFRQVISQVDQAPLRCALIDRNLLEAAD